MAAKLTAASLSLPTWPCTKGTMEHWDRPPLSLTSQLSYPEPELQTNASFLALAALTPVPARPDP